MKKIRVATLNINNNHKYLTLCGLCNSYEIDIFSLNEYSSNLTHKIINNLLLTYQYCYSSADYCGNIIFSRYKIISFSDIKLETNRSAEMRSAALIVIEIPLDDHSIVEVGFVSTHLSHIHESDRKDQIRSLIHKVILSILITLILAHLSFVRFHIQLWF